MKNLEIATLAGGCFWCTEAVFNRIKGIVTVIPGYSGGEVANPTYEEVSSGITGHAESIQITFDPKIISYSKILDLFWHTHNPTTINKQGHDEGPQYRSVIFYHDENQHQIATDSLSDLEKSHFYKDKVVTEILPFEKFYPAEDYHQKYYESHQGNSYCTYVIDPKIQYLFKNYPGEIKEEYLR